MVDKRRSITETDLEKLTNKILRGEEINPRDEKMGRVLQALIDYYPQHHLSLSARKKIDNIVQHKIQELTIRKKQKSKNHPTPSPFFFMSKRWKFVTVLSGGFLTIIIGFFAFFMMVAAPYVIGSNVDTITKSISANAPIKVTFSTFMNHQKTEQAFTIEPAVKGRFEWQDNTLLFIPQEPFPIGDRYTVTINTSTENIFGRTLQQEYWIDFIIQGPPEVIFVAPRDIVVGKEAKVVVMFNQPMTSMQELDKQTVDNVLLDIMPRTEGVIKWIDTSSFEFVPKTHLLYASKYTVLIKKGTTSLDGGQTERDFSFSFETIHPKVVSLEPENNYDLAGPTTPLKIHFNQPVDLNVLTQKLTVVPDTKYNLSYDEEDSNIVRITPMNGLQLNTNYTITIGQDVKGTEGEFAIGENISWQFKTVGTPALLNSEPSNGQKDADIYSITLYFNNPMNKESFKDKITIVPETALEVATDYWEDTATSITLTGELKYATSYTLTIKPGLKDAFDQVITQNIVLPFTTKNRDPYMRIARKDYYNLFNGYQNPVYPLKTINLDSVDAFFCHVSKDEYIHLAFSYSDSGQPQKCIEKKSWKISTKGEVNKIITTFIDFKELLGHELPSGVYYLSVSNNSIPNEWERKDYVSFFVSKTALTMKTDKEKMLVWATDLASGLPMKDVSVSLIGEGDKVIASGKTDEKGLYKTPFNFEGNIYIVGERDGDIAFLSRWWSNGISPWDFGYGMDYRRQSPLFAYLYTDRPIYRPEQKVFFKGIVRVDHDARFTLPDMKEITVIINDAQYNVVYKQTLPVSSLGTFNGEFLLDKNAPLGQYQLYVDIADNNFYQNFFVEEYRKPEFKVDITSDKADYTDGDTVHATVVGSYYFGGALKNKDVKWTINTADYYFSDYEGEWYSFTDNDGFWYCFYGCQQQQSFVTSGEGKLDENGSFAVSVPISLKDKKIDQVYTLEATIQDSSNQTVSNRIPIRVHKGNYYVGIKSDEYSYTKGDNGTFKVLVLDLEKKPVSSKHVSVSLYERMWDQVQKKNIDGEFYTEYEPKDTLVETKDVTTDQQGKGTGSFTFSKGGEVVLKASLTDEKGRTLTSTTTLYVSDEVYISWFSGNDSRIDLIPDKQEYKVGDTAKILIKSPFENVKALLTYERRNIFEYKIIDVKSNSQTINIPITDQFVPNTYVSVVLMKGGGVDKEKLQADIKILDDQIQQLQNNPDIDPGILSEKKAELQKERDKLDQLVQYTSNTPTKPDFRVGYTNLKVNNASKQIHLDLSTDKERYLPREKVNVSIKTSDYKGQSIPRAEVSVAVVDQSVLALKTKEEDIIQLFYGKKDLGVETASSMSIFTDTILVKAAKAKGGGGGGELPPNVRGNFKDTAYFKADILTDQSGNATISFELPDNLTTWKVIAVAVDKDTLVGSSTSSFMTTKELIASPVTPRFFRNGDQADVAVIVHNGQTKEDVVVSSLEIVDGDITIAGSSPLTASIAHDGEYTFHWNVNVGKGKSSTLLFKTKGNTAEDNVQITLPVLSYATPEVIATSGETDTSRTEKIRLSSDITSTMGDVTLKLSGSLLTNITQGLQELIQYPYGCAEQVMSALLSTVSSTMLYQQLGYSLPELSIESGTVLENEKLMNEKDPKKKIDLLVQIGLQKIYSFQRSDGGWGYWTESTESYAHLTAYELFGLQKVQEAGYTVDEKTIQRGIEFLQSYIKQHSMNKVEINKEGKEVETDKIDPYKANERAFALYALSLWQRGDLGLTNQLYEVRSSLHLYAQGYLLMTLLNMKEQEKATVILKEILARLTEDINARTAHFEEKGEDPYSMNTDIRTTAIILQGILRMDSKNPVIAKIVRYLVSNKKYERYINPQELTYSLFAIQEYIKSIVLAKEGMHVKAHINNDSVLDETLKGIEDSVSVTKDIGDFIGKNNEVTIEKTDGPGTVYYDIIVKYFLPILNITSRNNGFSIKREYFAFSDDKEEKPVSTAKVGDILKGKLTIVVPKERNFVVVESHLPAGLEPVNFNLETTEQTLQNSISNRASYGDTSYSHEVTVEENTDTIWGNMFWTAYLWMFNHREMRDDRVVLFADHLYAGVYEYEYLVQVTSVGTFAHPPAIGYEMYFPEIFGRSRGEIFTVTK